VANVNEAHIDGWQAAEQWRQGIGYARENVSDETEILLIIVPCKVCEHCRALAFKAEKLLFISPTFSPPNP
jgi:hypothetical protein